MQPGYTLCRLRIMYEYNPSLKIKKINNIEAQFICSALSACRGALSLDTRPTLERFAKQKVRMTHRFSKMIGNNICNRDNLLFGCGERKHCAFRGPTQERHLRRFCNNGLPL